MEVGRRPELVSEIEEILLLSWNIGTVLKKMVFTFAEQLEVGYKFPKMYGRTVWQNFHDNKKISRLSEGLCVAKATGRDTKCVADFFTSFEKSLQIVVCLIFSANR